MIVLVFAAHFLTLGGASAARAEQWSVTGSMVECRASNGVLSFDVKRGKKPQLFLRGGSKFVGSVLRPITIVFDNGASFQNDRAFATEGVLLVDLTAEMLSEIAGRDGVTISMDGEDVAYYGLHGSANAVKRFRQCLDRMTGGIYRRRAF